MIKKNQLVKLVGGAASVSLTGLGMMLAGQFGCQAIETILAGLGINVGSNILDEGLDRVKAWMSGEQGLLNHDIQKAWIRAAIEASKSMQKQYSPKMRALPENEKAAIDAFFEALRAQLDERFSEGQKRIALTAKTLEHLQEEGCPKEVIANLRPLRRSFQNEAGLLDAIQKRLSPEEAHTYQQQILKHATYITLPFSIDEVQLYLDGEEHQAKQTLSDRLRFDELLQDYPSDFRNFFETGFLPEIQFFFKEELKKDAPENNKAWRAFQMLLLNGLKDDLQHLRTDQQAIIRALEKLNEEIEKLSKLPDTTRSQEAYWKNVLTEFSDLMERLRQELREELRRNMKQTTEKLDFLEVYLRVINKNMGRLEGSVIRTEHVTHKIHDEVKQIKNELRLSQSQEIPPPASTSIIREDILAYALERPFFGRDEEFQHIETYLHTHSSGYLAVTAPAGFGKTAFLTHWMVRKTQSSERPPHFVYHFFSQRFSATTSLVEAYRNILYQLCQHYECDVPVSPTEDSYVLQGHIRDLLQENEAGSDSGLIIVIDALDEAKRDTEQRFDFPFPTPLPDNVFIIFSFRAPHHETPPYLRNVIRQVHRIPLDALPEPVVAEWLGNSGEGELAEFAKDEAFVRRLMEVTKGLPLYLNHLFEELVRRHQQGERIGTLLDRMPEDFKEYIAEQLDELEHVLNVSDAYWELFTLLVLTKSFINRKEISTILDVKSSVLGQFLNTWQITRWLSERRHKGLYDFSHPLLADAFKEIINERYDTTQIEKKLLDWCACWQEHRSRYALQYYPEHLLDVLDTGQYDDFFELVRNADFRQTQQQTFPHDPDLPLHTLKLALQTAIDLDDAPKIAEFMLAHANQIMATMEQEIPLDPIFAEDVNVERAWELADMWKQYDQDRWLQWYLLIALALHDHKGLAERAVETLERLQEKCSDTEIATDDNMNLYLFGQIHRIQKEQFFVLAETLELAPEDFVKHGFPDAAFELVAYFLGRYERQAQDEIDEDILKLFFNILQTKISTETLEDLSDYKDYLKRELHRLVDERESKILPLGIAFMLFSLKTYLAGDSETKESVVEFLDRGYEEILFKISPPQFEKNECDDICKALEIMHLHVERFQKAKLLHKVALVLFKMDKREKAIGVLSCAYNLLKHLDEHWHKQEIQFWILRKIACTLHKIDEHQKVREAIEVAYELANQFSDDRWGYVWGLSDVARIFYETNQEKKAKEVAEHIYKVACQLLEQNSEGGLDYSFKLKDIINIFRWINEQEKAHNILNMIHQWVIKAQDESLESKDSKLWDIIHDLIDYRIQGYTNAVKISQFFQDHKEKDSTLYIIIREQVNWRCDHDIEGYLQTAEQICNTETRDEALCLIVKAQLDWIGGLEEAMNAVHRFKDDHKKIEILAEVEKARADSREELLQSIQTAKEIAQKIESEHERTNAFFAIANALVWVNDVEGALQMASLTGERKREPLLKIVKALALSGNIESALQTVKLSKDSCCELLVEIMKIQLDNGDIEEMLRTSQNIEDLSLRGQSLYDMMIEKVFAGDTEKIRLAFKGARLLDEPSEQAEAFFTVLTVQAALGDWQAVQSIFSSSQLHQYLLSPAYPKDQREKFRQDTYQAIVGMVSPVEKEQKAEKEEHLQGEIILDTFAGIQVKTSIHEIDSNHLNVKTSGDELVLIVEPATPDTERINVGNIVNNISKKQDIKLLSHARSLALLKIGDFIDILTSVPFLDKEKKKDEEVIDRCISALFQVADTQSWETTYHTLDEAVEAAEPLELCIIAVIYNRSGNRAKAHDIFESAIEKIKQQEWRKEIALWKGTTLGLHHIAYFLSVAGETKWALEIAEEIMSEKWVNFYDQLNLLNRVLSTIADLQKPWGDEYNSKLLNMFDLLFVTAQRREKDSRLKKQDGFFARTILNLLNLNFYEHAFRYIDLVFDKLIEAIDARGNRIPIKPFDDNEQLPFAIIAHLVKQHNATYSKPILLSCAYYPKIAYEACETLARAYPDHAAAIAEVVKNA